MQENSQDPKKNEITPLDKLHNAIKKTKIIIKESILFSEALYNKNPNKDIIKKIINYSNNCLNYLGIKDNNYSNVRAFLNQFYYQLLNEVKLLFVRTIVPSNQNYFSIDRWQKKDELTLFFANYILMNQNYRLLKEIINDYFIKSYKATYELICDNNSPLWDITDMKYAEILSDRYEIRNYAKILVKEIPNNNADFSKGILEEQVSEILKNAIVHGNKNDKDKIVKVWFSINEKMYKIIVEDEGEGFKNFDEWNDFNRKRNEALKKGDLETALQYIQYRGPESTHEDGGNALFAAIEYWDSSLVYNKKKNKVAAIKYL